MDKYSLSESILGSAMDMITCAEQSFPLYLTGMMHNNHCPIHPSEEYEGYSGTNEHEQDRTESISPNSMYTILGSAVDGFN